LLVSLNLEDLWSNTYGEPQIRIAILDGTIDCSHLSLVGASLVKLDSWACETMNKGMALQHGTHVTSLIFGQHNGPILGIAPNCQGVIIPIFRDRKDGSFEACSQAELAIAINRAVEQRVHIINISAGEFSLS
jgi:subtilisin family serine protease